MDRSKVSDIGTITVARTRSQRTRGLLGRDSLAPDEAFLIPRCRSIHTFGMRFTLTVAFLDESGRVLKVRRIPPGRFVLPKRGVRHIMELADGAAILPGEQVPIPSGLRLY